MITNDLHIDKELVPRLMAGDAEAMKTVFRSYYLRLLYFTVKLIGNKQDAEDLVQEALLNFWVNVREKGVSPDNIQRYLFRMVRNRCINYLQRQKKDVANDDTVIGQLSEDAEQRMEELRLKEELYQRIAKAFDHLTTSQQEVMKGMFEKGLSVQELADQLNTTPNNIRNHKARAIERLRQVLDTDLFLSFLLFFKPFSEFL